MKPRELELTAEVKKELDAVRLELIQLETTLDVARRKVKKLRKVLFGGVDDAPAA
jgi:predicted  nucleic acid-binding Zn-ribbon protein